MVIEEFGCVVGVYWAVFNPMDGMDTLIERSDQANKGDHQQSVEAVE